MDSLCPRSSIAQRSFRQFWEAQSVLELLKELKGKLCIKYLFVKEFKCYSYQAHALEPF